jgi:glutamate-1-semialdehyde 2,1-aminomutase
MKKIKIQNSKNLLKKAIKLIPLGSQTFSKSYKLYDKNFFPLFAKRGFKQFIEDVDGNIFLDFVSGLGSVSLGYSIKEIDNKIKRAIKKGVTLSLSHPLEFELAKELRKIIPSAEMVRFGKNGTDANSAAIRLARYYTGRDHIAVCGYHGWQDWYIASTSMSGGIPKKTKQLTHVFSFNDINSLKILFKKRKFAAVIIEPLSINLPKKKFLQELKKICKKNNTVLIFDEICTGFRIALGGAQELYNVVPDLSTFGKAIGNGYPISAIVGKKKIMKNMDKIFYSGTFGGETISLEACMATINFIKKNKSIKNNIYNGSYLMKKFNLLSEKYNLKNIISLSGHPSWPFLIVKNIPNEDKMKIKTFFMQEYLLNKILFIGTSFVINASHKIKDIKKVLSVSDQILSKLSNNISNVDRILVAKVSKPLFRVRN